MQTYEQWQEEFGANLEFALIVARKREQKAARAAEIDRMIAEVQALIRARIAGEKGLK